MTWSHWATPTLTVFFVVLQALLSSTAMCLFYSDPMTKIFHFSDWVLRLPCPVYRFGYPSLQADCGVYSIVHCASWLCNPKTLFYLCIRLGTLQFPTLNTLLANHLSCSPSPWLCELHPCFLVQPVFCDHPPNLLKPSLRLLSLTRFHAQVPTLD